MSKKQRDPSLFLRDILKSIRKIEKYTKNMSLSDLKRSHLVADAVIRNFEIIGEAAKNIPKAVKNNYPHIAWKEAAGFRDILIHDYFGVDVEAVWDTIKNNLPEFKKHIQSVINSLKR